MDVWHGTSAVALLAYAVCNPSRLRINKLPRLISCEPLKVFPLTYEAAQDVMGVKLMIASCLRFMAAYANTVKPFPS